jgi:hypothetical protein
MTGGPVSRAASAGVARRRVETVVVFCVLAAATAAGLLGLTLATSATEFASAFAASHGAHLAVTIDAAKITGAQLAATRHLPAVTQAAGPYPETTITLAAGRSTGPPAGRAAGPPPGPTPRPPSRSRLAAPPGRPLAAPPGRRRAAVGRLAVGPTTWAAPRGNTPRGSRPPAAVPGGRRRRAGRRGG